MSLRFLAHAHRPLQASSPSRIRQRASIALSSRHYPHAHSTKRWLHDDKADSSTSSQTESQPRGLSPGQKESESNGSSSPASPSSFGTQARLSLLALLGGAALTALYCEIAHRNQTQHSSKSSQQHDRLTPPSNSSSPSNSPSNSSPYATAPEMLHAAREIASSLSAPDLVTFDPDLLDHHGHSDWSTANSPQRAAAVVYPQSTADVVTIARICHAHNVPMVPYGAGSSVEGNFAQPHSGICIDFSQMDRVLAIHADDMDVVVQPGVNWMDLNSRLAAQGHGLFFPMDPSPTATFGGMVSTNCSGTNAMRYGTMKDWVLNLTVVLPNGDIVKTRGRGRPRKTSAGYNLTSLFVGAEGTLGLVTEITLKLAPVPADTSVAVVSFPSIADAARTASALIRSGIQLGALEIMDEVQMGMLNRFGSEVVRKRVWEERPTLFLKFAGTTEGIRQDVRQVGEIIKTVASGREGGETGKEKEKEKDEVSFHFAETKQEEHDLWAARKEALFTMVSTRPPGTTLWSTDVAVPLSRLAEIINISKQECSALGIFATVIGHVGDGNFHVAMMYDPKDAEKKAEVGKVVHNMMRRALEMEGTVSGEHAIGMGKKECLVDELGRDTIGLMQTFKRAVDPKWIMNPGKVFEIPEDIQKRGP